MDTLHKQVRVARRRLLLREFCSALIWAWFIGLMIAAAALAVPKIWALNVASGWWAVAWLGGAIGVGLLAAAIWTWRRSRGELDAAIELDQRFGLRERVSSALALDDQERQSEAGQALLGDAVRRVDRIDVAQKFPLRLGRKALLPLLPAAAALILMLFINDRVAEEVGATPQDLIAKQVQEATQPLEKKIAEQKKEAREKGLNDAAGLFEKIEEGLRDVTRKQDIDRQQAMVKLNDLAKDVDQRRQQLGADDPLKEQLQHLKNTRSGPADKLAKAMKEGDFKQAMQELDKLQQQLAKGGLDKEQQQQLAQQMADMQKKLQEMADAQQQAQKNLQQQLDQLQKSGQGGSEQAQKLQQQLDQLERQAPQMDKLSQLADQLGQAAKSLKQGDAAQASKSLEQLQAELSQRQRENDELQMLDEALEQISQAKDSMNCEQCQGEGCAACQGGEGQPGDQMAQGGAGKGDPDGPPGQGMGEGRGQGARPEEKTATKTRDSNVRQKVGRGGAVVTGEVDGPNRKGEVQQRIREEVEFGRVNSEDSINQESLPKRQREHVQEYFDSLREGG